MGHILQGPYGPLVFRDANGRPIVDFHQEGGIHLHKYRDTYIDCPQMWVWPLAHQNRTIAIASDFHVDGAKSPEIPQKEGVLGSEIAARNRRSLATFHRTLNRNASMLSLVSEIARFLGSAVGIAIANRKKRCDFGALRSGPRCRLEGPPPSPPPRPRTPPPHQPGPPPPGALQQEPVSWGEEAGRG